MEPHQWIEKEYNPNEYGPVVYQSDEAQVRYDGRVWSIWDGKRIVYTTESLKELCPRLVRREN